MRSRTTSRVGLAAALVAGAMGVLPSAASAQRTVDECPDDAAKVVSWSYDITRANGSTVEVDDLTDSVRPGDKIVASFSLAPNCIGKRVSLASYRATSLSGQPLEDQRLFDSASGTFTNDGTAPREFPDALEVDVFKANTAPSTTGGKDVSVTRVDGNPKCASLGAGFTELKIDPVRQGSTTKSSGAFSSTIRVDGRVFDFTTTQGVDAVIVKGGPNANVYRFSRETTSGSGLHAPINPNNGQYYGLSHVTFCYDPGEPVEEPPYFQVDFATGPVIENLSLTNMYGPDLIDYDNGPELDLAP